MFQQERERASATKRSPAAGPTRLAYSCWTVPAGTFCRVLAEKNGAGRRGFLRHPISADNGTLCRGDGGREGVTAAGGRSSCLSSGELDAGVADRHAWMVCSCGARLLQHLSVGVAHSKLENSSDEVEDVKADCPIGPGSRRSTFWPRV